MTTYRKSELVEPPGKTVHRKYLISLVVCLFIAALNITNLPAQPKHLQFNYLTPDDGLSSSAVISIKQDYKGFMWIGTYHGLNRYDGKKFEVYKSNPSIPGSLQCDQVRAIYEDKNHNLLIGTNCGLSQFDPSHNNFINFMAVDSSALFGIDCNVYKVSGDSLGQLWVSTNIGLIRFDRENNTSEIFNHDPDNPGSISNSWVEYTFVDSKGRHWVSTRGGLNLFDPVKKTFKHITKAINPSDDFSKITFLEITEDVDGNIWFGSYAGLFCLENTSESDDALIRYVHNPDDPNSISGNRLLSVFVDKQNNLWVGAENDGLFLFNREKRNFWHYQASDYDPASLNNESIQEIFMDNCGNLWLGTFGGGLNISPQKSGGIIHFRNLKGSELCLSNNVVSAFHEDYKGRVWIGTDGGGLNLFDEVTKRFKRFNMANSGFSSNVILSIVEDKGHNLWMGTWGGGIIKFNPDTKSITSFTTKNSRIPDNNIFAVELGNNNDLWLGSYRNGLINYKIGEDEFTSYNQENSAIGNNYVYVIKKDGDGGLYFGTTNGLKVFSPKDGSFVIYPYGQDNPRGVSHGTIYDILIENDTCIWIGTQSGLNRLNPETGIFRHYYTQDGLPNNVVKGLVLDKTGVLWVTTNGGVCKFDYKNNKIENFTRGDGLQSNEFNFKSTMLSGQGNLFLGGVNGFNIIYPEKLTKNLKVPDIVFTGLEILNKPVAPNTEDSPLTNHISETKEITLRYKQSVFSFSFAVMDFTGPEKNQYAYMLENFDDDWIFSGNEGKATYTNLDQGEYILRVKGSNNDGIWNEAGASMKITILPPWWLTLWFKIIVALIAIAIIISVFYLRTAALRKQKELLVKKVDERTNDLNEKNALLEVQSDYLVKTNTLLEIKQETIKNQAEELQVIAEDLEKTNKELTQINATKDKLFSIIAHDLKNPFNVILGYSDLLLTHFDSWPDKEKLEILANLKESADNAYNLLENLLNWSRSQRGTLVFEPVFITANEIVAQASKEVISFARKKNVKINTEGLEDDIEIFADPDMLLLVCRNLLMNAIKFSNPRSGIYIRVTDFGQQYICFSIRDEGVGMDKEKLNTLFDVENNKSTTGTKGEKGTGLGLILCYDFITWHKGKIWVESAVNKGATFYFTIPRKDIMND